MEFDPNYLDLYDQALRYDRVGDPYTAVKLLKKVTKLMPEWPAAFAALGDIYYRRREWKPATHYLSRAVALNADDRDRWWKLSQAAVGTKRLNTARTIWE